MAKHSRTHRRSHRRSHSRVKRGGGNYTSASTYGEYVNGTSDAQFNRVFNGTGQSNIITGVQGQNATASGAAPNLNLIQSAGRKRHHIKKNTRRKRGGIWGQVINQAIVPFGILGLQQTYRRKRHH